MKLSTVVSGSLILIIIVSGLFVFLAESVRVYQPSGLPSDYNSSFMQITNQITSIQTTLNETNSLLKVSTPTDSSFLFDYISFFFKAGYQSLVVGANMILLNNQIIDLGIDATIGGSEYGNIVKASLGALLLLTILTFIMSVIFKWEV
jgi:hypothetical protein